MVSVLVSVADSYATKPLPLKRFRMEAEVGIEPNVPFTLIFPSPRQNASCRTYAANPCKIAVFGAFVKLLTTLSKL